MEKNFQIKLRVCIKDENGVFKIKKILNDISTKMELENLRKELEKQNIINQDYEFLEDNCAIEKDTEKDFFLEDIIRENNKIFIQKKSNDEENKKIDNLEQVKENKEIKPPELKMPQKIKENTQSQIKFEKNNSMKVDKELKNKSQNKQNENALDSLIEIKEGKNNKNEPVNEIKIKKESLKEVNNFIACLGAGGTGKSTFCSFYYQRRYNVRKNIFKPSAGSDSDTKGIKMLNLSEKRKIEQSIEREILDVEGFSLDNLESWKYTIIISFLSTELIILNRGPRYEQVKYILGIMQRGFKEFKKKGIPKMLKKIYIQYDTKRGFNKLNTLKTLNLNKKNEKFFDLPDDPLPGGIKIEFVYLPSIQLDKLSDDQDIIDCQDYIDNFDKIIELLKRTEGISNAVASLEEYIDNLNEILKGYSDDSMFDIKKIYKDIESDFEGVYNKYENKFINDLRSKEKQLILPENSSETFEKFIAKQNLNFKFKLIKEDFTFYGSSEKIDKFYDDLISKKSFLVEPKQVFMEFYTKCIHDLENEESKKALEKEKRETEKLKQEIKKTKEENKKNEEKIKKIQEESKKTDEELKNIEMEEIKKRKELEEKLKKLEEEKRKKEEKQKLDEDRFEIKSAYYEKEREINNYFATLKFYQEITNMDLTLKIKKSNSLISFKEKFEKKLMEYFTKKTYEKEEEWKKQISNAQWKQIVQAQGELKCENGHNLEDYVICRECKQALYWVDSDTKYVLCKGCPIKEGGLQKMTDDLVCDFCEGKALCKVKWLINYKP